MSVPEKGGKLVPIEKDVALISTDNIIAKMFRRIMIDLGANNYAKFNYLLERYVMKYGTKDLINLKDRSSERNNIRKELLKDVMSFKVFASKAIRFLGILKFDVTITLHHPNGQKTAHTLCINMTEISRNVSAPSEETEE